MTKVRLLLAAAFAVFAVSAVASSSASAAACVKESGELFAACIENELQTGSVALTGTQEPGENHVFVILTTTPTTVNCLAASAVATAEPTGVTVLVMAAKIEFSECLVTSDEADCEVATGKISTEKLDGTLSLAEEIENGVKVTGRLDVTFTPEAGEKEPFATFTIKSKAGHTCLGAQANGKVKGTELCFFLETGQSIEANEKAHLLQCVESGLTFAGTAADLETEFELVLGAPNTGKSWSVVEGS
jgi:hypothetical protein